MVPEFVPARQGRSRGATPLNIVRLQERILLLQQDPRIERINAELKPGDTRGESILNVRVKDATPFKAWLEFNNYQTPVVGAERGLATVAHQNVTGNGDAFTFTYGRSQGVNPLIDTSYSLPLNSYETTFTAYYRKNSFLVVEDPFQPLDLNVDSQIIGLSLRQPVYRTVSDEFALSLTGEHLYLKTTSAFDVPGLPSLFIPGSSSTGVATVSALRFSQEYIHRSPTFRLCRPVSIQRRSERARGHDQQWACSRWSILFLVGSDVK